MSLGGTTLLGERAAAADRFQQIAAKDPKPRRCALDNMLRIRTASEIFRGTQPKLTLQADNSAHASHNKRTITIAGEDQSTLRFVGRLAGTMKIDKLQQLFRAGFE
jgi:riboflavin biosynthesis pyrimidine reductase